MLKTLRAWLKKHEKASEKKQFDRGFDWCSGQLMRGTSVEKIENQIDSCRIFDTKAYVFDNGALEALQMWERHAQHHVSLGKLMAEVDKVRGQVHASTPKLADVGIVDHD